VLAAARDRKGKDEGGEAQKKPVAYASSDMTGIAVDEIEVNGQGQK